MLSGIENLTELSHAISGSVAKAADCIVAVNGNQRLASSGIVWRTGIIATADHTLRRDEDITIVLPDGRTTAASLAGRDPGTDLAVLRADTGAIAPAQFADPASLHVGNLVLAVGRRGENGPCASLGIISALGGPWRTWRNGQLHRFVRADLNLYPGSSGSALFDTAGQVIGLNTAGLTRNWSVTVPRETVDSVVDALLSQGRVTRGFLGVGLHPVRLSDGRSGLIVLSIEPDGPAAKSGMLIGDVVLGLNGHPVADTDDVQQHLGPDTVDKAVPAEIYRGGVIHQLPVTVGSRPQGAR